MQHSHPILAFKLLILFPPTLYLLPLHPHHRLMLLAVSLYLLLSLPLPNSLKVLQSNAGVLRARSTKLIHFNSFHPVNLIHIQDSNLNSSSSFRIPGFSALQSHGTHSRTGIFSTNIANANDSSSSLSFLNVYAPPLVLLRRIAEPISFLSPFFPPKWKRKRWIFRASASTEKVPLPPLPLPHPCL